MQEKSTGILTRSRVLTLSIAAAGAAAFWFAGIPLPLLLGPMFACLAFALAGVRLQGVRPISEAMRAVLGVAVGASVTPDLFDRAGDMVVSVALVPVYVLAVGLIGYPYFRRLCGFDRPTAYFAAMPGGLQDMIVFGQEAGGDVRALSLVHATRVVVIVSLMPVLLATMFGRALDNPPGEPATTLPLLELGLMVGCAVVGWVGAKRIGLFGASILGPMIVTMAASLADLIHHRPPAEAIWVAQFFIGLGVGVQYVGITVEEIRRVLLAALGYCLILAVLSVVFAEGVHLMGVAREVEALLAFAPGGQSEMVVLAIVAGADMAFVVTHHLTRLIVVIAGAPLAARWFR